MADARTQQPRKKISRQELNLKIEAARLRVFTDSKQKKETPEWVLRLASRPTYPGEQWELPRDRTWWEGLERWWSGRL
jgi:hypothetical protein